MIEKPSDDGAPLSGQALAVLALAPPLVVTTLLVVISFLRGAHPLSVAMVAAELGVLAAAACWLAWRLIGKQPSGGRVLLASKWHLLVVALTALASCVVCVGFRIDPLGGGWATIVTLLLAPMISVYYAAWFGRDSATLEPL